MKIDKLESLVNIQMPHGKENAGKAGETGFQKIFEEIQAGRGGEKQRAGESSAAFQAAEIPDVPFGVHSLSSVAQPGSLSPGQTRSLQAGERALKVLEDYGKDLGDPGISLKEIYPLIQSLSSEVRGMNQDADKLPGNDPLKRILNEIGVLAAVEVERFNRGDYLS
jgi:hypothetical protein